MKTNLLFLLFLVNLHNNWAQTEITTYYDTEREVGQISSGIKYQNKIIYVGATYEASRKPAMVCVDTNGVVLWNTCLTDVSTYNQYTTDRQVKLFLGSDGFVYSAGSNNNTIEYWKVNPNTGQIIWKNSVSAIVKQPDFLLDYSTNQLIMVYSSAYNGAFHVKDLCLIDKSNGSILSTKTLGVNYPSPGTIGFAIDQAKNIYYSNYDSIKKLASNNWNSILWQRKYSPTPLSSISNLHFNDINGSLIALATKSSNNQRYVLTADTLNGLMMGAIPTSYNNQAITQITQRSNELFISLKHNYVGSLLTRYCLMKMNLTNNTIVWELQHDFGLEHQGIRSFDFDSFGNVYCTGYYGSSNYGPGKWGIIKVSPSGNVLFSQTVNRVNTQSSNFSDGIVCSVIDNKPCFLGAIDGEASYGMSNSCFALLNASNGNIVKQTYITGESIRFNSYVTDIINYQNGKQLVLTKKGRYGQLICYDSLMNELWRANLVTNSEDFVPHRIAITDDGYIWASGIVSSLNNSAPYVSSAPNDIIVFRISPSGAVSNWFAEGTSGFNARVYDFIVHGNDVYLIYNAGYVVQMKKVNILGPNTTSLNFLSLPHSNNNYSTKLDANSTLIVGYGSSNLEVKHFSAATGNVVSTTVLNGPSFDPRSVTTLNPSNILIGGNNYQGRTVVSKYNTSSNEVWRYMEPLVISETVIKIITSDDLNSCYVLSNTANDIVVRKINTSNGSLIWKKTYNGTLNNVDQGSDIVFDPVRDLILVSGSETFSNTSNKVPLYFTINTQGLFQDTIRIMNSQNFVEGKFNKICLLNSGLTLSGGNYYSPAVGSCGMLTMLDTSIVHVYDSASVCSSFTWNVNGVNYVNDGDYTHLTLNSIDTLYHLNLLIQNNSSVVNQTSCGGYLWNVNGMTYNFSGQYIDTLTNLAGCDSIVTLNLIVNPINDTILYEQHCDSYTWPINGILYTQSGQYIDTIQNSFGCDSIITLNLTILNSSDSIFTDQACGSYFWPLNGQTYSSSGFYNDTIPNAVGCDSIVTLDLTITPLIPLVINNTFSIPSDPNNCLGELALDIAGNGDFYLLIDNGAQQLMSTGYSLIQNLCPGVHDLQITDYCGDALLTQFVIPVDSNYVFNNPFIDSIALDSLGTTATNCTIYYNSIDTAYIDSIWTTGNTVSVIWNIVDSNGSNFDTTSYVLNNGNGVYWLQLSVFCPTKALGDYFTVTQAINFEDGGAYLVGMDDELEQLLVEVYPNPTNNEVTIAFESNEAQVIIYDTQGKLIQSKTIHSGEQLSLKEVETGVYLFEVITEKGTAVKRVVKR